MPVDVNAAPAPSSSAAGSLLDRLMPTFDVVSRHAIVVPAPRARVVAAAESHRIDSSPVTRLLFRLRGLGAPPATLRIALTTGSFRLLAEAPGEEIVLGTYGRFWALAELRNMRAPADAEDFVAFARPGWAKAALAVRFESLGSHTTRLGTETRVLCTDDAARRRFQLYWTVIGPFSGMTRRILLRGIRDTALR